MPQGAQCAMNDVPHDFPDVFEAVATSGHPHVLPGPDSGIWAEGGRPRSLAGSPFQGRPAYSGGGRPEESLLSTTDRHEAFEQSLRHTFASQSASRTGA
jgi:hypothetical protein